MKVTNKKFADIDTTKDLDYYLNKQKLNIFELRDYLLQINYKYNVKHRYEEDDRDIIKYMVDLIRRLFILGYNSLDNSKNKATLHSIRFDGPSYFLPTAKAGDFATMNLCIPINNRYSISVTIKDVEAALNPNPRRRYTVCKIESTNNKEDVWSCVLSSDFSDREAVSFDYYYGSYQLCAPFMCTGEMATEISKNVMEKLHNNPEVLTWIFLETGQIY